MKTICMVLCGVLLAFDAGAQAAIKRMSTNFGTGSDKTEVMADSVEYDLDSDWARFKGNVAIRYQGSEIRADEVSLDQNTGEAVAVGRVIMVGNDGSIWHGDHLMVNIKKQTAKVNDIDIYSAPFRILADAGNVEPEFDAQGRKKQTFAITNAVVTTCTNETHRFHYELRTSKLRVRQDRDLAAWGAVPYLFGVPFFYMPYYWRDLNRSYGFRFEPGYQGSWGPYLLSSYKLPLYLDRENDTYLDAKTSVDYRYKRGWAFGERLRWGHAEDSAGWFSAYYLNDQNIPWGVEDKERYRLRLNQSWNITTVDKFLLQGLYVSDERFMENFFTEEYREMDQPNNFASYTHYASGYSFGLLGRVRLNDFYTQVERLPEAWFNLNSIEIFGTGVYLENSSSMGYLQRKFDTRNETRPEDYSAFRADSYTRFSMPLKISFLNIVPRAGFRATYYDTTLEHLVQWHTESVTATNEFGEVMTYTQNTSSTEQHKVAGDFRTVFEAGSEISLKAYGFWQDKGGNIWRHVIEPYADYTYIPEPNIVPSQLYQFDIIDRINRSHNLRLGTRNRWQVKGAESDTAHERVYNNIYTDINLDPENGEKSVKNFFTETRFRPNSWLRADLDTRYNFDNNKVDLAALRFVARRRVFDADIEYRYRSDISSLLNASVTWHSNKWSINGYGRYEFETTRMEEVGTWIERRLDCIAFRLYASVHPAYITERGGGREKDDYRFSLLIWLTDFVPEKIREKDSR